MRKMSCGSLGIVKKDTIKRGVKKRGDELLDYVSTIE